MASLQLRDLWLRHLKICRHIYLMGARQFNRSETFWWDEVNWEDKTDDIFVIPIQNYCSQILFDSVIFVHILPKNAPIGYFKWPHNLWSDGCLVSTTRCPHSYPANLVSGVTIGNPAKLLLPVIWWSYPVWQISAKPIKWWSDVLVDCTVSKQGGYSPWKLSQWMWINLTEKKPDNESAIGVEK